MSKLYNLALDKEMTRSAKYALLPTYSEIVPTVADQLDKNLGELATGRGFKSYLGLLAGKEVLVVSSGIGGPSISTAVHELASLGVETIIRIGTTGAIQEDIHVGEMIITSGSMRLDGASTHYASVEYPAISDHRILRALEDTAAELDLTTHTGISATTDTFYPGQERYSEEGRYVIERFRGSMRELKRLGILCYDMETAPLFVLAGCRGLKAGCVQGVVVNRMIHESVDVARWEEIESNAVRVAVAAMKRLIA